MQATTCHLPATIIYGENSFLQVGVEAAKLGSKALIISDAVMERLGNVERAQALLEKSGIPSYSYLGVATEPTDTYVYEALDLFRAKACNVIVSLGGGSCIDTAKAVAVLAVNGGAIDEYMNGRTIARKGAVPLIALPTTGGTGSEATDATVITNTDTNVKMMIKQQAFMPRTAIVDPVLTKSTPKHITAATGIDALTHALEAYISKRAHPFTDGLALSAMERIFHYLLPAYKDGNDIKARHEMLYGSLLAGMAFSNSSVCLVHGMSRPIGALFHVTHGVSNAMLLPVVLEYTKESCQERLASIGRVLFPDKSGEGTETLANTVVEEIVALCAKVDIPTLPDWGVKEEAFMPMLPKMADDALESGSPQNNPRVPSKRELVELYKALFQQKPAVFR
ncbi:iron-containing alcohol dehydrogenase [Shouchella clausii]|uniref:iron-containing alcohol dehydrogenase n=2 Tax=Shouchella clausii TaxID=79880 RepID=UPI003982F670